MISNNNKNHSSPNPHQQEREQEQEQASTFDNNNIGNGNGNGNGGIWIGIDLGTSNSSVAVWDSTRGRPKWIRLPNGIAPSVDKNGKIGRLVPSLVDSDGKVGALAYHSPNIVSSVKRLIGLKQQKRLTDEDIQFIESLPFQVLLPSEENNNDDDQIIKIQFPNGVITTTPDDVITTLLQAIRLSAQRYLELKSVKRKNMKIPGGGGGGSSSNTGDIRNVVIGVPAHFSKQACNRIIESTKKAGFDGKIRTCLESTAAAMAYGLTLQEQEQDDNNDDANNATTKTKKNTIMVIDMGGGTTDITIATKEKSDNDNKDANAGDDDHDDVSSSSSSSSYYKVLVTQGDSQLGGDDIDYAIMEYCLGQQQAGGSIKHKKYEYHKIHDHNSQNQILRIACRKAKEALCDLENPSTEEQIKVDVDTADAAEKQKSIALSKEQFEILLKPWLQRAKVVIDQSLEKLKSSSSSQRHQISEVILVGGTTRIPAVRDLIQTYFPNIELCTSLNPMSSVAQGLAIQSAILSKQVPIHELKSAMMLDCIPHAIGVLLPCGRFVEIIPHNTPLPARGSATFTLADRNQPGVTIKAVEEIDIGGDTHYYEAMSKEDFTFLLKRIIPNANTTTTTTTTTTQTTRKIEVGMMVDTQGQFIVSIFDENDPEQVRKRNRLMKVNNKSSEPTATSYGELEYIVDMLKDESGMTSTEQFLLISTLIGVFVLYIAVKIAFAEPGRDGSTIL